MNESVAMNAYKAALTRAKEASLDAALGAKEANSSAVSGSQGTFSNMVRGYLNTAVDENRAAEELSIKAVRGEADLTEVVTAVANAEAALKTVVTVRDRVIRAYEEIIRMPV